MAKRIPLSEDKKIEILHLHKNHNSPSEISRLTEIPRTTVSSFLSSYEKHKTINPKRGRKAKIISDDLKIQIENDLKNNPTLNIRDHSKQVNISNKSMWNLRHDLGFGFYKLTPCCELEQIHLIKRINYSQKIVNDNCLKPIIFTDESTVLLDPNRGQGIWRQKGHIPPEGYAVKNPHPLSVMVWGAIGAYGFRTNLIKCPKSVTALSYCEFLSEYHILFQCSRFFNGSYIWQQDNASPHTAVAEVLREHVPSMIDWPPKSPDLSPIEQVWDLIKDKLKGRSFKTEDELFAALEFEWNNIPNHVIHNFWSSYYARCKV